MRVMFMYQRNNSFVCLDEITHQPEDLNPVIYNPGKDSLPFRSELLYRTIFNGTGHELTSEQLMHLCSYDVSELEAFKSELRKIIYG